MAVKQTSPIMGGRRGDVQRGDEVMVEMGPGEGVCEGQIVAESPDGKVTVAVFDGTTEVEVERYKVWRDGFSVQEI